jgi:hypothetical protein
LNDLRSIFKKQINANRKTEERSMKKKLECARKALARHPLLGVVPSALSVPFIALARDIPWLAAGLALIALLLAFTLSIFARESMMLVALEKRLAHQKKK